MSLEQVIEQDMIRFLDGELEDNKKDIPSRQEDAEFMLLNRDWEKEIKAALKRGEVENAKALFNELKQRYNEAPASHPAEREKLYNSIRTSYIAIINYIQERSRTTVLLQHMEQSPGDVFNAQVKPVNLQKVEQVAKTELPEYVPLTLDTIEKGHPSIPADHHDLSLPPPPNSQYAAEAPKKSLPPLPPLFKKPEAQVDSSAADVASVNEETFVNKAKQTFEKAIELGKDSPAEAKELLSSLRGKVAEAGLSERTATVLVDKIDSLSKAIMAHEARRVFAHAFNTAYAGIADLARSKDTVAFDEFKKLQQRANEFEEKYPVYAGTFSKPLSDLQQKYSLYEEDALYEVVRPLLEKIKAAAEQKNTVSFLHSLDELDRFTSNMPRIQDRVLLEHSIESLRQKAVKKLGAR
jgi:hypothetical protein